MKVIGKTYANVSDLVRDTCDPDFADGFEKYMSESSVPYEMIQEAEPTPGRRRYRMAWADRLRFMRDVLGLPAAPAGDGVATIARIPHQCSEDSKLYAVEAEFQGEGMECRHAIVTVTYAEPVGAANAVAREALK